MAETHDLAAEQITPNVAIIAIDSTSHSISEGQSSGGRWSGSFCTGSLGSIYSGHQLGFMLPRSVHSSTCSLFLVGLPVSPVHFIPLKQVIKKERNTHARMHTYIQHIHITPNTHITPNIIHTNIHNIHNTPTQHTHTHTRAQIF